MTKPDLDELLGQMPGQLPLAAQAEAQRMVNAAMPVRIRHGRAPRARWVLPVVVSGGLILTAGASTAVITMSHWAGVSMPVENVRNNEPIPISWTTDRGHVESCRVWIELRNPPPNSAETLDAAITSQDWSGVGQELYDTTAPGVDDDSDGESRVSRGLDPVVHAFAAETFPGVGWLSDGVGTEQPGVEAWGFTCVPPAK